ncbi:MAG: DUF2279 domain-containing protein [Ignavibacteriales bacterium]|nr:DUF2279 domain-containing protein [Ignavibacteriales bacterium]
MEYKYFWISSPLALFFCLLFCPYRIISQETALPSDTTGINYNRFTLVTCGTAGIITGAHLQSYNSWWKNERSSFHIHDEGAYALGADKFGHFYFTNFTSDILGRSYAWAGVDNSFLLGACIAFAFELYVEIEDGYTKKLGFSPGDFGADAVGAAYPYLRNKYSWMNNFDFKVSVYPSANYRNDMYRTIIDDYESIYYWLSLDRNLFPDILKKVIPEFITLAIGYGVKNIVNSGTGKSEIFISFDYDFDKMPGDGSFIRSVKHILNYIHFPAPAIRLTPSVIFYGLKF